MANAPGNYPNNQFTQMIERVKEGNVRGHVEGTVTGTPPPNVQSAAMVVPPMPLTDREREELDAQARAAGVMLDGDNEQEPNQYKNLDEALEAGKPVAPSPGDAAVVVPGRMAPVAGYPKLPDFSKVGGIDLIRDVLYVDGMEFEIPAKDAAKFRRYCLTIAQKEIFKRMKDAATKLARPEVTPDGGNTGSEEVPPLS